MKERIKLAEEIIRKKYDKKDPNYGLLVLSCYGLLTKFENYTETIINVFHSTDFYIENETIPTMLKKEGLIQEATEQELEDSYGVINYGDNISIFDGYLMYDIGRPQIFCSTISNNYNEILNILVHELTHCLKRKQIPALISKNQISIQMGLHKSNLYLFGGEIYEENNNVMLENVINTLQTTEMMKEIGKINPKQLNKETKKAFDLLDLKTIDWNRGYESEAALLKPLWETEEFKELIEKNTMTGNLKRIEKEFNQRTTKKAFQTFSSSIDYICSADSIDKEFANRIDIIHATMDVYINNSKIKAKQKKKS